jgi:sugar lactone lactonase YvrE
MRCKLVTTLALLVTLFLGGERPARADLFVSDYATFDVHRYSSTGADLGVFTSLPAPTGIAFDSAANVYVVTGTGNVERFSPTGAYLGTFVSTGLSIPWAAVFDPAGNLFLSYLADNTIHKFSSSGANLGRFASLGSHNPTGLGLDKSGNVYVASFTSQTIRWFSPTGRDLGVFASGLVSPSDLAFDAAGDLYVSDAGFVNQIHEFSPTGTDLGTFVSLDYPPSGIAFDDLGNLYVFRSL